MVTKEKEQTRAKSSAAAERAARERFEQAMTELREGSYRFASKVRGQAQIIVEELVDPDGETVMALADVEGDAGALALSVPIELITFETWLLGQYGDEDALDLDNPSHRELWLNFGAWIGTMLRLRHGGHWLIADDDPRTWRLGFSKIMLEIAPHVFAERLLQIGTGCAKQLIAEIERIRLLHQDQNERDGGTDIDRFTAQHYVRLHTMPLGQWMVMDLKLLARMWNHAASRDLVKEIKKNKKRLGEGQGEIVDRVAEAISKAKPEQPIAGQTQDRGLFEAVAQIIAMRRATAPIAMDILEKMVIPAAHIGIPDAFPPLDDDDLQSLRQGIEYFALFVDVVPHKYPAHDGGFLGAIPNDELSTPYGDRNNLEVGKGDWVIVNPRRFQEMLVGFDTARLLERYDAFVKYVASNPKAPRRRDDGRLAAETVARALAEIRACVASASKDGTALVFRMLPPPG
ncbi:MAG TPA: hypothetical protein VFG83_05210 [Kofleriaceae bacterium]|nr:hypothetical protein [Kofleriaceae bacterium]